MTSPCYGDRQDGPALPCTELYCPKLVVSLKAVQNGRRRKCLSTSLRNGCLQHQRVKGTSLGFNRVIALCDVASHLCVLAERIVFIQTCHLKVDTGRNDNWQLDQAVTFDMALNFQARVFWKFFTLLQNDT